MGGRSTAPASSPLGATLVGLPPHRFDREKPMHEVHVLEALDLVDEEVLAIVADEIADRTKRGELKCQPRLAEIKRMCEVALSMHRSVGAALARGPRPARRAA